MNNIQRLKKNFRQTSKWKKCRARQKAKAGGVDFITQKKLYKGWALHHLDLTEGHYDDISNEDNFIALNKQSHEVVHWLWRYYEKDKAVISRLVDVMDRMAAINKKQGDQ